MTPIKRIGLALALGATALGAAAPAAARTSVVIGYSDGYYGDGYGYGYGRYHDRDGDGIADRWDRYDDRRDWRWRREAYRWHDRDWDDRYEHHCWTEWRWDRDGDSRIPVRVCR